MRSSLHHHCVCIFALLHPRRRISSRAVSLWPYRTIIDTEMPYMLKPAKDSLSKLCVLALLRQFITASFQCRTGLQLMKRIVSVNGAMTSDQTTKSSLSSNGGMLFSWLANQTQNWQIEEGAACSILICESRNCKRIGLIIFAILLRTVHTVQVQCFQECNIQAQQPKSCIDSSSSSWKSMNSWCGGQVPNSALGGPNCHCHPPCPEGCCQATGSQKLHPI